MSIEEINREINDLDSDDIGLKRIMGNRFQDESKKPMVEPFPKEDITWDTIPTEEEKKEVKPKESQWKPTKERCWMDDLKECAKSSLIFGGLNLLIWYWQISGLMDESIALPCMLVCAALFGLGIGKCCKRGKD
jgi:hypothetical protein